MPKRRSLVGTAREAMGESPAATPKAPPVKRARPESKAKKQPMRETMPVAPAEAPVEPKRGYGPAPAPATPYEAIMSFANATLRQNMETSARLARCKSPMEAIAAQTAHAAAITRSFIAVSLRLMQLGFAPVAWRSGSPRDAH